jgi:hexosaminidase
MNWRLIVTLAYSISLIQFAHARQAVTQEMLDHLAADLHVIYQVNNNLDHSVCLKDVTQGNCYQAELQLTFAQSMPAQGWEIYFSQISPIQWEGSDDFDIQHINGDLHRLSPSKKIVPGKQYVVPLRASFWSVSKSDVMPNYFVVADGLKPVVIASTVETRDPLSGLSILPHAGVFETTQQNRRNSSDHLAITTPEDDYIRNAKINSSAVNRSTSRLIPKARQTKDANQWLELKLGLAFSANIKHKQTTAIDWLSRSGLSMSDLGLKVNIATDSSKISEQEGYRLTISAKEIEIVANSDAGVFYALMSLAQLYDPLQKRLPIVGIKDSPEFEFRGLHIDVARNFHSKDFVLRLLQQMAAFKMNKLHFHLADDEGWRLQITDLPELTEIGAYRCFDLSEQSCLLPQLGSGPFRGSEVNGYYSSKDYIEILKYADARHIEVIPSLDMPGHSRAAVKSMLARHARLIGEGKNREAEEFLLSDLSNESIYSSVQHYDDNTINPCLPSTYHFIDKVLSEVARYHAKAGIPLKRYHIGADETAGAWAKSPVCNNMLEGNLQGVKSTHDLGPHFITRIAEMLAQKDIIAGAWSDGAEAVLEQKNSPKMQVNIWDTLFWQGHNQSHKFTNAGWQSVLSQPDVLYFDFPYAVHSEEPGYYWASRATDSYKVFQFMPQNLPAHAAIWPDRMGLPYRSTEQISLAKRAKVSGIQAQLWSEAIRSDNAVEFMLYPRLLAVAERAWHRAKWTAPYQSGKDYNYNDRLLSAQASRMQAQDWAEFSSVVENKVLPSLIRSGVFFRIPPPGAKVEKGTLHANSLFSGLQIHFRELNGEWRLYEIPISVSGEIELRSSLLGSQRNSRIVKVN